MPRFKDKEIIKSIGQIYLDDPVYLIQSLIVESGEEHIGFRVEKVIEAITALATESGIATEVAYLMVWFMDAGLVVDESLYLDIVKEYKYDEYRDDKIPKFEKQNKYFMHGRIGELMLSNMYMIGDDNFAKAVCYHETLLPGREHTSLEKILFIADKLVPKFDNDSHVEIVSQGLRESYNSAIRNYLEWYLDNAPTLQLKIHPYMPRVLQEYRNFSKNFN